MRLVASLIGLLMLAAPGGRGRSNDVETDADERRSRVAQLTLNLSAASIARMRAASARSGLPMAAYISASVGCASWNAQFVGSPVTIEWHGERFLSQLPTPGIEIPCPCHRPSGPVHRAPVTAGETLTAKITPEARDELKGLARRNPGGPLTMQDYVEASTWVEQWNFEHRLCRITIERPDGTFEMLLPYAGIVQGRVANAR